MEEAPENGKELSLSAHVNGMKPFLSHLHQIKLVVVGGGRKIKETKKLISKFIVLLQETKTKRTPKLLFTSPVPR
jgi:hypothetical protein